MTDEQFETLVRRLEVQAQSDPGRYQLKVILLALLGNAYLGAMILLILAVFAASVASVIVLKGLALKLIIVVGTFLWIVLRALWVKIEPPAGTEMQREQAPDLFALVDGLRGQLSAPRFHHLLITGDFNAGVVQSPRLGIFGWPRNYLLVGLPLMKSLTFEQFKAVLAHEFGHLAKGHGSISNGIYRQRLRWSRLLIVLAAYKSSGSFLFKPFLNWFAPYFSAYSFPMARANEYAADATSVRLTSPQAAAEALTAVDVVGHFLGERYWPRIQKQADNQPHPNFAPYSALEQGIAADLDRESAMAWLDQAMTRQTSLADTHPALRDRLNAIGEPPRLAPPPVGQGADRLLGDSLRVITENFDQRWKDEVLPFWAKRYEQVQEGRRRLAELNGRFESGVELDLREALDRALLTATVGDEPDESLSQLQILHERAPDSADVCLGLGAQLLLRNDASGSTLIERGMQLDESTIGKGCELLRDFCWRNGRKEEARAWQKRFVEHAKVLAAATEERNRLSLDDAFESHGLSEDTLAQLCAQLRAIPGLRTAYYVRKQIKHFPTRPIYVFCYGVTGAFGLHGKQRAKEVLRHIEASVRFPGETIIISAESGDHGLDAKFKLMAGAKIL